MKITLVMVSSVNGRITKGDDPNISTWTSKEDSQHFSNMLDEASLIVMGSSTYEAAKEVIELQEGKCRIILTRDPKKYVEETVPGQLEFTDESPSVLVERLEKVGYKEMLLAGGGEINKLFFEEHLVNELYLTIEPKLFGKGKLLVQEGDFYHSLELESVRRLNEKGTLLMHFRVQ